MGLVPFEEDEPREDTTRGSSPRARKRALTGTWPRWLQVSDLQPPQLFVTRFAVSCSSSLSWWMNLCFRKIVLAPREQQPGLNLFWVSHSLSADAQNRWSVTTLSRAEFHRLETLPVTVLLFMLAWVLKRNIGLQAWERHTRRETQSSLL